MKPTSPEFPTAMFEVMPYNYWCRDWYETASNVADVEYFSIMNSEYSILKDEDSIRAFECYSSRSMCTNIICHDFLRDKKVKLNIDLLKKAWSPFQKKLDAAKERLDDINRSKTL